MAWHKGTITDYKTALTSMVAFATSKHVSAVALNNAGTGYSVGDILTVAHASGYLSATIEVLTTSSGPPGPIATFKLRNMGAYAIRAVSAVVPGGGGGTGYAVGDILEVQGGTVTEKAKFQVATLSGSAVATVTLFETGGAYTASPANDASTTKIGPAAGSGSGCTLTVTYQAIVGATGIAVTGGTGASATFDLTLTQTGWTALRNLNSYSFNSVTNEKEVVLVGTVSGGDEPYIGMRTYTQTVGVDTRYGILCVGMTSHNAGISFDSQSGIGPQSTPSNTTGAYIPLLSASQAFWFKFSGRSMAGAFKCQGVSVLAYMQFHLGLPNPFGTTVENPYPLTVLCPCAISNEKPDAGSDNVTGISEACSPTSASGPLWYRRITDATWRQLRNREGTSESQVEGIYPGFRGTAISSSSLAEKVVSDTGGAFGGSWVGSGIFPATGGVATRTLKPTLNTGDNLFVLVPLTIIRTPDGETQSIGTDVHAELDGIYWLSGTKEDGTKISAEDTLTIGSNRYTIIPNAHRTERYSFVAFLES